MLDVLMRVLERYAPRKTEDGRLELELPVVTYTSGGCVTLLITPSADGYTVALSPEHFYGITDHPEIYHEIFVRHGSGERYGVAPVDGTLGKSLTREDNPIVAVSDVARYAIALDDFLIANDVIGNESAFS